MTSAERDEILCARLFCDDSLINFTRYFYKRLRGSKFILNWHHETICNALADIGDYKFELLNINIPPRFSKTELVLNFIARSLGENPSANFLYISASDDLRSEASTRIRDIITDDHFQKMYGVEMKKDQSAKNLWRTKQGGGLKTATIFGQITGFGAGQMKEVIEEIRSFEGCIVLDDINKIDDSVNITAANKKTSRTIFNTILSRRNSSDTPIINIQQRAGLEDATFQLLEHFDNDKTINLILPAIGEDGSSYEGQSLWKWKMPLEELLKLKKSPKTSHTFETQYMQNPQPVEGLLFHPKHYEQLSLIPDLKIFVADPADEGKDFFVGGVFAIAGGKVYMEDVICNRKPQDWNIPDSAEMIISLDVDRAYCESNGKLNIDFKKGLSAKLPINVAGIGNSQNKHKRIYSQSGYINDVFYFKESTERKTDPMSDMGDYETFLYHLKRYTKEGGYEPDDPPDMIALASRIIRKYHSTLLSDD